MSAKHGCCADKACNSSTCMALPAGKTCGDCAHLPRCEAFGVTNSARTSCDWFPRRFREPVAKPITSVAEFCAEADRIGLTGATLAAALSQQPEFADCLPPNGGVLSQLSISAEAKLTCNGCGEQMRVGQRHVGCGSNAGVSAVDGEPKPRRDASRGRT